MRSLVFFFATALFSCGNPVAAPPESRGDKMAKSLCGCTAALLALNQQAESASDSLAFRNIAAEFEKARACAATLGFQPDDRAALETTLQTHCPALAAQQDLLLELLGE
ncbi:MAG: hypothetical protein ACKVUS_03950 [Saprospiraceae bacterium]